MQIHISLRGPLARVFKTAFTVQSSRPLSLYQCLQQLLDSNESICNMWADPTQIDQECLILVNDVDAAVIGGLDAQLDDGDVIILLPLIHGG